MKIALMCAVAALLSACATVAPMNSWGPTLAQIKAASALKVGVSTVANVEAVYGVPCVPESQMTGSEACVIAVIPGYSTLLMYNMRSEWQPSCWEDIYGCQSVSQVTNSTLSYRFDAHGILASSKFDSSCTAYVNEYVFKNGCLDHD